MVVKLSDQAEALGERLEQRLHDDPDTRTRIISIGLGILLHDGKRLLRGPQLKAADADSGWVDLTDANMAQWQKRFEGMRAATAPGGRFRT